MIETSENIFLDSKVGDKVYHISMGWGTIDKISGSQRPLQVSFGAEVYFFRYDGKVADSDINPVLYKSEVEVKYKAKKVFAFINKKTQEIIYKAISLNPDINMWERYPQGDR